MPFARNANYPFVLCSNHPGTKQQCFVVCNHVAQGRKQTGFFVETSNEAPGQILCEECGAREDFDIDRAHIFCAACARENNWLPAAA